VEARMNVYNAMIERLNSLVGKMDAASQETRDMKSMIAELQKRVGTFEASLKTYRQALADLKQMGCKTDPTGFRAALEAARKDQADVVTNSAAIRTFINDSVKPTLDSLKTAS
jgi:prefoldin subunit 5